ncbi:sulfatase family protein [Algisphaera agarilytica]|uniref:Arylsulfatase A-like enzyme n=1 Tax=Algisphaera agarilytica TaxID=1385975 RepID=A0A7X0H9D8_9BACT|nr:sulfatase-like hydrolase/transferase [Algisphaera agarilytica]MBB6431697.1 arylsulfatase A-like enzyme [Algisphaera agarilytica]
MPIRSRLLACLCVLLFSLSAVAEDRPNFIVIMADDLGYNDVGFNGSEEIFTPRLDELAANGVIFNNGYVTHAYCGPSRAGLITGRYQARFGVEVNFTSSPFDIHQGLPLEQKTFGNRMQAAGYRTGIIGKWHLGASYPFHPNNRGFDYFYGFLSGGHDYFPDTVTYIHPLIQESGKNAGKPHYSANETTYWPLMRNENAAEFDEYLTTALSRDAAKFVKESDKPFCLYLAYNAPHGPLQAPKELIEKYNHIEGKKRRVYAAMIDSMDSGIGMVVDALKESGKYENTLIFFLSDNGGVQPKPGYEGEDYADNSPYRGGKGSMVEGGTNVPFIAHWPKGIPAGTVYDYPVSALDITGTFVALGDGDTSGPPIEGKNLIPYITGENTEPPHEAIFLRMVDGVNWMIRTPEAKLLLERPFQAKDEGKPELYDMVNDPYETNNIIDEQPELRAELAKLWNDWNKDNVGNRFLQAGNYQKTRLKFYEDLQKEQDAKAAKYKPIVVE